MKNKKYRIRLDNVYPKKPKRYANTLEQAKREAKALLYSNQQGTARIEELKVDGKSYKSFSSHWWAFNRETHRDRIVGL